MGVPYLNRFLKQNASRGIYRVNLSKYRGKKIAIDTSIYLYRFMSEDLFVENFYTMMTIFIKYEITPIFIFDGIPPEEKKVEIEFRYAKKKRAHEEYNTKMFEYTRSMGNRRKTLKKELDNLKRQFIKVEKHDIQIIKNLIQAYGLSYYTAIGEADVICADLMINGIVDACMSDDMDLFVYGCNKVLRYLSILNSTVIEYDLDIILKELDITFTGFKQICIASGTDYNKNVINNDNYLEEIYKYYQSHIELNNPDKKCFYSWITEKNITEKKSEELYKIELMFDVDNYNENVENITINNGIINSNILKTILSQHGFIFI